MNRLRASTAIAVLLLMAGLPAHADNTVMRVSHQLPPLHAMAKAIDNWADLVEKYSDNTIDVQVFPAEQLYKVKENYPAVAKGDLECAYSINTQWGETVPALSVTMRPYSVTDFSILQKWVGSPPANALDDMLAKKGVRVTSWLPITNVAAVTSNNKPLIRPEDYKGLKIRGTDPIQDKSLAAMGAAPVQLSGPEVYQALQTGLIDAGITDFYTSWVRKYYEVQNQIVATPMFSLFYIGYCNPSWYDGLTHAQRSAIEKASAEETNILLHTMKTDTDQTIADYRQKKGVSFHVHTPEEIKAMKAAMLPAFDKTFKAQVGPDADKLVQQIDALSAD